MIWMSVGSVRAKGHNNLRFDPADMGNNFSDDFLGIRLIHISINIVQKAYFVDSQMFGRTTQFLFTDAGDAFQARVRPLGIEPAALPARRTDQIGLNALAGIACQSGSKSKCFVIGMGEYCQQFQGTVHSASLPIKLFLNDAKISIYLNVLKPSQLSHSFVPVPGPFRIPEQTAER